MVALSVLHNQRRKPVLTARRDFREALWLVAAQLGIQHVVAPPSMGAPSTLGNEYLVPLVPLADNPLRQEFKCGKSRFLEKRPGWDPAAGGSTIDGTDQYPW